MTRSPVYDAYPPASAEEGSGPAQTPDRDAGESDAARPFGEQPATRFAADVEYRGRAGELDYVVRVRHRLLDTTFTVAVDGIEHDPKAEEKARKKSGEGAGPSGDVVHDEAGPSDDAEPSDDAAPDDGLQFGLDEGFSTLRCTVRRRADGEGSGREGEGGEVEAAEVITIRTAGLGGAGEVDVRHGLQTTPLVPAEGSPSAARDEKRTAHPTRYALVAALTKAATFLIPLLGLGALLSGLLDPVKEWIGERIRPVIEAIGQVVRPIRDWLDEVTAPVRDFLDTLLAPVRELIAAILRPIGEALRWLLGLLPDIGLNLDVPDWLVDVLVPVVVVVAVFVATFSRLRHRREKLAETASGARAATASDTSAAGEEARSAGESSAQN